MKNKIGYFENADGIGLFQVGEEDCLIDFAGQRVVLSCDAVYELAIQLALFMQRIDNPIDSNEALLN